MLFTSQPTFLLFLSESTIYNIIFFWLGTFHDATQGE